MIQHLSDKELIHHVDNKPSATELERTLANRLDAALQRELQLAQRMQQLALRAKDDRL